MPEGAGSVQKRNEQKVRKKFVLVDLSLAGVSSCVGGSRVKKKKKYGKQTSGDIHCMSRKFENGIREGGVCSNTNMGHLGYTCYEMVRARGQRQDRHICMWEEFQEFRRQCVIK